MGLTDSTNSKRSKNNQVPEYEDFFGELSSNNKKPRKGGVVRRVVKHDFWRILLIVILYTIKASPLWVLPVVTSDVIDVTTTRPEGYVNRLIIDGIIFFRPVDEFTVPHIETKLFNDDFIKRVSKRTKGKVNTLNDVLNYIKQHHPTLAAECDRLMTD